MFYSLENNGLIHPCVFQAGFEGLQVVVSTTTFFYHFIIYIMKTKQLRIGKYVIINELPILFPIEIMHSDVVPQAQSAGFFVLRVSSYDVDVYCWGESTSLNVQSNQAHDARIIKEFMSNISEVSHRFGNSAKSGLQQGIKANSPS
jgi:hypothetical protein